MTEITGKTRLVGVIGHPIGHSLSSPMHNGEFERLGMDYVYVCYDVHPDNVRQAIEGLRALGVLGVNVTIPHKQAVMPFLDEVAEEAQLIGAVNTVHFTPSGTKGYNTDMHGWVEDIEQDVGLRGQSMCMIGTGGAAQAVSVGACAAGVKRLVTWDTRADAAAALGAKLKARYPQVQIEVLDAEDEDRRQAMGQCGVVVNTTPVGMESLPGCPVPEDWLLPEQYVYDVIYTPAQTRFIAAARRIGCRARSGLGMLARQGARAFEIWTGTRPSAENMEATLRRILKLG